MSWLEVCTLSGQTFEVKVHRKNNTFKVNAYQRVNSNPEDWTWDPDLYASFDSLRTATNYMQTIALQFLKC